MMINQGAHRARLVCPDCSAPYEVPVFVDTRLVVEHDKSQLTFKVKAKPVDHECGGVASEPLFRVSDDGSVVDGVVEEIEP